MKRLYFTYDLSRSGGEAINPDDEWPDYETTYIEVEFHEFYRETPKHRFFCDSVEVDESVFNLAHAFLAVIRYSTGDTFGHTEGCHHIVGAYASRDEANDAIENAINGSGYKPWDGYFERLTGREVHKLDVI